MQLGSGTTMSIIKQLRDDELQIVAEAIRDHIFVPSLSGITTVFLCGADLRDNKSGRSKMAKLFEKKRHYELIYPEDLFDDLLYGQGQHNLLLLENILADSVDSIVLLPESPGSFAELGAFASNKRLVNKLICVGQERYSKKKSFINYGPVRLIKMSKTGKVFNFVYDDIDSEEKNTKIFKRINDAITNIKKKHPIKKGVANIMQTENFILPIVYLFDSITSMELYKLVEFATGQDKKIAEIATRSSISRLIKKKYISRIAAGYEITAIGIAQVRSKVEPSKLDIARFEIMNSQLRQNTIIKTFSFECACP